MRRIRNVQG